ncbi:SAP domain-containing ribonucleoprotein [Onthophagus taurus]|uniref:SAP domain-containing ribonucleoprotein n=1 Tax=Onthophagus taurus TaxID=166361 RepID=UPI000C20AA4B|nr:SAP domain-containing ribonucleoprotein [Onthophagus taurus]
MDTELDPILDISKMKVPDLKRELKLRGLSATGNKTELLERLKNSMKSKLDDTVGESVDDLEEDLLNDDDDASMGHLDGSESGITDIDGSMDISMNQKGKRKSDEVQGIAKPAKKVILNRTSSVSEAVQEDTKSLIDSKEKEDEKKVVKLSELSAKDRLEMRAKKFGVELSDNAKKIARAERFGGSEKISAPTNSLTTDVLKQRAERFGLAPTATIQNLNNEERKKKRQERFGSAANGSSQNDKLQQRLERFKQTVK